MAEVQVRTLFEEAWSEIDHRIRYPHAVDNVVLAQFLAMFNRLAGSADEMGTYIKFLEAHLSSNEAALHKATIDHDTAVAALEAAIARSKLDAKEKADLEKQVRELAAETKRSYGTLTVSSSPIVSGGVVFAAVPHHVTNAINITDRSISMRICDGCKSLFTYSGDEVICPDCRSFQVQTFAPNKPKK